MKAQILELMEPLVHLLIIVIYLLMEKIPLNLKTTIKLLTFATQVCPGSTSNRLGATQRSIFKWECV